MTIDSKAKRLSMMGLRSHALVGITQPLFVADGTIDLADRQHLLGLYSGIEFTRLVVQQALGLDTSLIHPLSLKTTVQHLLDSDTTIIYPLNQHTTLTHPIDQETTLTHPVELDIDLRSKD